MSTTRSRRWLAVLALALGLGTALPALDVGAPAPPLKIAKWLKGEAVEPATPNGRTLYVVEFWATWCPPCKQSIPHLNQLQAKYRERQVLIVGISNEDEPTVREFMKTTPFDYRVAIDDGEATSAKWLAGIPGIPHAFLVGTDGKLLWRGHPLALEPVLDRVLGGTFSPALQKLEDRLDQAVAAQDVNATAATLDQLLALDPATSRYYEMKLGVLAAQGAGAAARLAVQQAWVKNCARDPLASTRAAQAILADEHPDRDLARVALRNALQALETPAPPAKDK